MHRDAPAETTGFDDLDVARVVLLQSVVRRLTHLASLFLLPLVACTGPADEPGDGGRTWTVTVSAPREEALSMLYVVDPTHPEAGTDVRTATAVLARQQLDELRGAQNDPGVWMGAHWTAAVIDPTAHGAARWGTPLTLRTERLSDDDVEAFAEAIVAEANGLPTMGVPYAPADAIADGLAALFRQRPLDATEEAWSASFDPGDRPWAVVVNALMGRVGAAPSTGWTPPDDAIVMAAVVAPSPEPTCALPSPQVLLQPTPDSVLAVLDDDAVVGPAIVPWPCAEPSLEAGAHLFGYVDVSPRAWCTSTPLQGDAQGRVECKMWAVDLPEDISCAEHGRGWDEPSPDDLPFVETQRIAEGRVCEVPQLTGAPLSACRKDRDCEDCGHGWCQTTLDFDEPGCAGEPTRLRFVGRSVHGSGASFVITCALED